MNKLKSLMLLAVMATALVSAHEASSQNCALKTNFLYWLAGGTANASLEFATSNKVTWELTGAYNPWTFKDDKKMKLWLAQPAMRYWFCEKFEGSFISVYAQGAQYYGGFRDRRYDGYLAGGGISYGYSHLISPHWSIEFELGLGYDYLWYKESDRVPCIRCQEDRHKNYVGPNKAGITLIYQF